MNLNKTLKSMEIEPTRILSSTEKDNIIKEFVQRLINTFPEQNLSTSELVEKMYNCEMYLANFPENLGSANYFYKNKTIYFKEESDLEKLDDYMIHELIHYLQDERDKHGNLYQMGICYFSEFKMYGMAMNEAAVQYITSMILNRKAEEVEYGNIRVKTNSKNYYPLFCNLIMQIAYLIDKKLLVKSTLFSQDDFIYKYIDIVGEAAVKEIQELFDLLLEAKQEIFVIEDETQLNIKEKQIISLYENAQNKILTSYFNGIFSLLEDVNEIETIKNKIEIYKNLLGNVDSYAFYTKYKQEYLEKLDEKVIVISRKKSRNMLANINNNKIFAIIRKIKNLFFNKERG